MGPVYGYASQPLRHSKTPPVTSEALLVLTTCSNAKEAARLADALVEERLAACVCRMEDIVSTYRWESKIQQDEEILVLVKTTSDCYQALEKMILQLTSYELPEIIAIPVQGGSPDYMKWLKAAVSSEE